MNAPISRGLFLGAAVLTAAAVALPLWGFRMTAPQYPGESLSLRVTTSGITGDVKEISTLQKYAGIRFPDSLPELRWLPPSLAGLAALLAAAGFARGRAGRVLAVATVTAFGVFLAGSAALVQVRLHAVGHERDPRAPLKGVKDFTPPLIGPQKVGNFTVWSHPHAGGLALGVAFVLAAAGARGRSRTRAAEPEAAALPADDHRWPLSA